MTGSCDWQLGWFSDVSDGAILLLRFLLRIGIVERQETILCAGHWVDHSLQPLMPTNSAWSPTQNNLLLLFVSKPSCVVVISLSIKFGLFWEALDYTYSALDCQQSGFWWCFQYRKCTIPIIQLSDNMILLGHPDSLQSLGVNQRFLLG